MCRSTFPGIGVLVNNGRLILEAGDRWGDELSSTGEGDGSGRDDEDSPGPDVRARLEGRPSCVVSEASGKGPRVPSSFDTSGIPEAP